MERDERNRSDKGLVFQFEREKVFSSFAALGNMQELPVRVATIIKREQRIVARCH